MHFDLVVVGTGSGNTILGREFRDQRVALVESGLFGGTCLNAGCIPTKSFVYPADLADAVVRAGRLGLTATVAPVDWALLRDRIFARTDEISAHGLEFRQGAKWPNLDMFQGTARFTGFKSMAVDLDEGGRTEFTADRFVLAAGGRPVIPDIPGLDEDIVGDGVVHTSDTIMRIDERPERIVVVGGGYIAAEFAHVFDSFGTRVTQVVRGSRLLRHHDDDVATTFTDHVLGRYDLRRDTEICGVKPLGPNGAGLRVFLESPYGETTVDADVLLLATGRRPNSDVLNLSATGVTVDDKRRVVVNEYQETVVPGIYALGDLSSPYALKHVANHEARVVRHNLTHPDDRIATDHRFVPAAVFTEPQIASVGLTERQGRDQGVEFVVGRRDYGGTAAGWAREDTTGFAKVLADPRTGLLLGAHVIGPEAATVIQPLVQAMSFGQRAHDIARGQYWIHPALPEVIENALLALPKPTG
ncbi:MAG TPA: mycothione reductase [Nakamurella sp.]|jgi:mycothione reductase